MMTSRKNDSVFQKTLSAGATKKDIQALLMSKINDVELLALESQDIYIHDMIMWNLFSILSEYGDESLLPWLLEKSKQEPATNNMRNRAVYAYYYIADCGTTHDSGTIDPFAPQPTTKDDEKQDESVASKSPQTASPRQATD